MIKVLHLITGLNTGGAEMMLYKLLSRMDREKFTNIVVSMLDKGFLGDKMSELGIPVYTLNMKRGIPNPKGVWLLYKILKKENPDILQTWLYHADLLGLIAGKLAKVPRLAWNIRCSNMDMSQYSKLSGLILKILAKTSGMPDVVLVNSNSGRNFHENIGYKPRKWEVIFNGFDLDRFHPAPSNLKKKFREELGLPENAFLIGIVARYDIMKGYEYFINAAKYFLNTCKADKKVFFIMVGKGVDEKNKDLLQLIEKLCVKDNVFLLGERKDISSIMSILDVMVSSSIFGEGFPNVVGEAMSCAIPCVVTDVGDSAFIVGNNGIVVPPKNAKALAEALLTMFEMKSEKLKEIGYRARKHIENIYDLDIIVKKYEQMYESMIRILI
ncbi:MAG: glycosyltransferase [Clostridiales bacterium]|jgi:glycosyltransferase involved in cell wall biosynthesis|nr:glycosyltransferase [Eubacteriales bacterium]MDH7567796.1 glycosyltransferase [Clostridiales bacterium]